MGLADITVGSTFIAKIGKRRTAAYRIDEIYDRTPTPQDRGYVTLIDTRDENSKKRVKVNLGDLRLLKTVEPCDFFLFYVETKRDGWIQISEQNVITWFDNQSELTPNFYERARQIARWYAQKTEEPVVLFEGNSSTGLKYTPIRDVKIFLFDRSQVSTEQSRYCIPCAK